MAAARCNIPSIILTGGPMLSGYQDGKDLSLIDVFEGVGRVAAGVMSETALSEWNAVPCPGAGELPGTVHGKHHGMYDRSDGNVTCRMCSYSGSRCGRSLELPGRPEKPSCRLLKTRSDREILFQKRVSGCNPVDMALGGFYKYGASPDGNCVGSGSYLFPLRTLMHLQM